MATVDSYTKAKIDQLIDQTIINAQIVGEDLVFTKEDGTQINLGAVGGGLEKVTAFPIGAVDGDTVVRIDLSGDPIYKMTDGAWELQPRMGGVNVPAVRATRTAAFTAGLITSGGSGVAIPFDTEEYDTEAIHDTASNTTRLTVKTPGLYLIEGCLAWPNNTNGYRELAILKNGTTNLSADDKATSVASMSFHKVSTVVRLVAGDYVEMIGYQTSGGSITPNAGLTNFTMTWLSGAGQTVDERGVPACKAITGADQSIPHSTVTVVAFSSELFDTDDMHSTVTNNSRFVAKTPGLYLLNASVDWANSGTGQRRLSFRKNGAGLTEYADVTDEGSATTAANRMQVSAVLMLAAGDYVELGVFQDNGTALNLLASSSFSAVLQGSGKTVTPFAKVYKSATGQTVAADGVDAAVSFDSEETDNDNIHDNVTNNTRLTCRTAGIYHVRGLVGHTANSNGTRWVSIRKNGSTNIEQTIQDPNDHNTVRDTVIEINALVELAVGDYVELMIANVEGSTAITLTAGIGARGSKFSMVKIGAPISGNTGIDPVEAITIATKLNAWANVANRSAPGFYKDRGRVYLVGNLKGDGASSNTAFQLPVGYRPSAIVEPISVIGFNAAGNASTMVDVQIGVDGNVSLFTSTGGPTFGQANSANICLETVSFRL